MKTLKQVPVTPVYVVFIPEIIEEGKIYISERYATATHLCLCGCGNKTVTPLVDGIGWKLSISNYGISLSPSISNYQLPCKSHYIITNSKANFV
jgi:hypothetical protein